jgi:hypothetical protein
LSKKAEAGQDAENRKREANRRKDTKPSLELSAYVGAYENLAYGTLAVSEDTGLVLNWSSFKLKLEHFHFDTFTARGDPLMDNQLLTFGLGSDATVQRLTFLDQEFKRVRSKAPPKN